VPKTLLEYNNWFKTYLNICASVAASQMTIAQKAKDIISNHLNDLWRNTDIHNALHKSIVEISEQRQWLDCLFAVNDIIHYIDDQATHSDLDMLLEMENALRPKNLLEKSRLYTLSESYKLVKLDGDEDVEKASNWLEKKTRSIAAKAVKEPTVFATLLPDIFLKSSSVQARLFGMGIADGSTDKQRTWDSMTEAFESIPQEKVQPDILLDFCHPVLKLNWISITPHWTTYCRMICLLDGFQYFNFLPPLMHAVLRGCIELWTARLHRSNYFSILLGAEIMKR